MAAARLDSSSLPVALEVKKYGNIRFHCEWMSEVRIGLACGTGKKKLVSTWKSNLA
jgi:hypothetical protein